MIAPAPSTGDASGVSRPLAIILALVAGGAVVGIILAVIALFMVRSIAADDGLPSSINSADYQAVFLSNGEIYFGRLTGGSHQFYSLRDVYVLQAAPAAARARPLRQVLVKLTTEIHQPRDFMAINRNEILFIENLNPSGKAARLISQSSGG